MRACMHKIIITGSMHVPITSSPVLHHSCVVGITSASGGPPDPVAEAWSCSGSKKDPVLSSNIVWPDWVILSPVSLVLRRRLETFTEIISAPWTVSFINFPCFSAQAHAFFTISLSYRYRSQHHVNKACAEAQARSRNAALPSAAAL